MTGVDRALPHGRYGKATKAKLSKRTRLVLTVCGVLFGVGVAYVGYVNLGQAPIEAERIGFDDAPGNRMQLTFEVVRKTPDQAAVCIVRVRGKDGSENGRKEVYVAPGQASVRLTTVITGSSEPVTADVFGCSYQVPSYLSTAQPPTG